MLRHELLKLATLRWLRVAAVVVLVLSTGFALLVCMAMTATDDAATGLPALVPPDPAEMAQTVLRTSVATSVLGAVIGVFGARSDVQTGTMRLTLVLFPDRLRVLLAKTAATAVVATAVAVVAAALQLGVVSAVVGPLGLRVWLGGLCAHAALAALWSVAGVVLGILLPTVAAGVAVVLAVPFAIEPTAVALLGSSGASNLLPYRSGGQLYLAMGEPISGTGGTGGPFAAAPLVVLVAIGVVGATRRFRRLAV